MKPLLPFALCLLPFALLFCSLLSLAQAPSSQPYATLNRDAVTYNGPGRDAGHDLSGAEIRIGLLAPLAGRRRVEGEALRRGAEMAIEEENAAALPGGRRLSLSTGEESGPWGRAASEVARLVFDERALSIITSAEGGSAHLAEQIGNKIGVPILTLSSDRTTTEINLPWIFRLPPADPAQARAFTQDIYRRRKLERVALLVQDDHDGRVGGAEFEEAAGELNAPRPLRITVNAGRAAGGGLENQLLETQAVVVWTDSATAALLLERLQRLRLAIPVYLCGKAAQALHAEFPSPRGAGTPQQTALSTENAQVWTAVEMPAPPASGRAFARHYRERFGVEPGLGAVQAYDAVRLLAACLRRSGPNRARLRDALAEVSGFTGASGTISFDRAGNNISRLVLVELR
jgi:branched-chain amino acid transport system substrate-binding protein